ncbi:MAG: polysaccharide deacetylase family protein [Lachnospiraceae bacterium]|nr:polysaccharide deacetylase family protein [Lachnospiraceae bacterium]
MKKCQIIMYHYVRDLENSRYPAIKGLDYSLFKEQLKFLKKNFNVIKIEDLIACYDIGEDLPNNAVLLTFDDGYIDHFTYVFPLLDQFSMQGTFYIPGKTFKENVLLDVNKIHFILASRGGISNILQDLLREIDMHRPMSEVKIPDNETLFKTYAIANRFDNKETVFVKRILQTVLPENMRNVIASKLFEKYVGMPEEQFAKELYMNEDQIKCMASNGMQIGLHGWDHYWLGKLDEAEMKDDIDRSLQSMEGIIDPKCWVFNYPYGNYNDAVLAYLRKKCCKLSMTTEVRTADLVRDDRLLLPRLDTNDFPPKSENYKLIPY